MISNKPDTALWESYKQGDTESFGKLFRRYYQPLFQFGSKFSSEQDLLEDCIQELFVELWQNKSQTKVQSVKAYLFKAIKYKLFRALQKKSGLALTTIHEETGFEFSHETLLISKHDSEEKTARVIAAMQQLSNRQKEIIYLKFYQELNYEEVSEIMGINYQVARNLFHQSLKALRKLLSPE
ncbi:RNA polymerase sigma factor [Terrimonas pollutisoli]|uniref:RNA polymerase sigma factor n=1 Tax=Terrimonas pollutisoli TaxID=3034147 RepID=UPI0023EA9C12|nr:sigma-70 family RNA polymerase sigma factor [Terrimonas sp. H1YJ31]